MLATMSNKELHRLPLIQPLLKSACVAVMPPVA